MKCNKKIKIIIVFSLFLLSLFINPDYFLNKKLSKYNSDDSSLRVAQLSGTIHINNNWSDTKIAGICTGFGNVSDPYIIEDFIIDGQGSGNCILIENSNEYFKIESCTVFNSKSGTNFAGIKLNNVSNGRIFNNNCSDNQGNGIFLNNSINNWIFENSINDNIESGLYLTEFCTNNTISKNNIANNRYGIDLHYSCFSNISDNIVLFNHYHGIRMEFSDNNSLSKNNVSNNIYYGIYLRYSRNNTIFLNNGTENKQGAIDCSTGSLENRIKRNSLSNNYVGFSSIESNYSIVTENYINNNQFGIFFLNSNNNSIFSNNINYNFYSGIQLRDSSYNTISNNKMRECGLYFQDFEGNINPMLSNTITEDNLVNNKALYCFLNKTGLNTVNFTSRGIPGQIILIGCNNSRISHFNISKSSYGIATNFCNNISISNCRINKSSNGIATSFCNNISISNCKLSQFNVYGLYLFYSNNSIISNNDINNGSDIGIYLRSNFNNTFVENNVSYFQKGFYIEYSYEIKLIRNIVNNNNKGGEHQKLGIDLKESYYNKLLNNTLLNNTNNGIVLDTCHNNLISGNVISNSSNGIWMQWSFYNDVVFNTVDNNTKKLEDTYPEMKGNGICLWGGQYNNLSYNTARFNGFAGIFLYGIYNISLSGNQMENCGLHLLYHASSIPSLLNIDTSNTVNNKPIYYYFNKKGLNSNNFSDPGQVILVNCNNSDIKDLNISYTTTGISLWNCSHNIIYNNSASFITDRGIRVGISSKNNTIFKNDINNCLDFGIGIENSYNNNISHNVINYSTGGIFVTESIDTNITDNTAKDNYLCGVMVQESDKSLISRNSLYNCGFLLQPDVLIDNTNLVNGKPFYYYIDENNLTPLNFTDPGQIYLINCNHSLISNIEISNASLGLYLYNCHNITLSNFNSTYNKYIGISMTNCANLNFSSNIINNNFIGFSVYYSSNLTIQSNVFNNNSLGLDGFNANNCSFLNNSFNYNKYSKYDIHNYYIWYEQYSGTGLYLYYSKNNKISRNIFSYNEKSGIILKEESNNCKILGNEISHNNDYGLTIDYWCYNNTIYYNDFSNNNINAEDDERNNYWDDGFAGNYWDDYNGDDVDDNGIGDTSYLISGLPNVYDNKPLYYPTNQDTDGEGLYNYEEYTLGVDSYRTNVTNPDSDYDGLNDYWEALNLTNPWNPDTDFDNMPDWWEIFYVLNATKGTDNLTDADNDLLLNLYEYLNGADPQNPDSDFDNMPDGWEVFNGLNATNDTDDFIDMDNDLLLNLYEFLNGTDPQKNDTDLDNMPDGWEVFNGLNATKGTDNLTDTDNDLLLNLYEYLNGTDPNNNDTDGDTFLDGKEVELNTKPLNRWWYPMPNLHVIGFEATAADYGLPFTLNFTIINNGIWRAENVIIIIRIDLYNLTLWDNFNDPLNLDVDVSYSDLIQIEGVTTSGGLVMELILDPLNSINETYSEKDGSLRSNAEYNLKKAELQIEDLPGNGGIELIWIILIIIGAVASAGAISTYVVLRPRIKRKAAFKRQRETARTEIENFETNIRSLIKKKLKDSYEYTWWDEGVPEYIKTTIETKIKALKPKKPEVQIDRMELLDFTHYSSIITSQDNWEQIFSKTFPDKGTVDTNFENLRVFKRDLNEGVVTHDQLSNYPLFIHNIRNYFTKGFNVFLSYSTLDTEYFDIKEVAKRLEFLPQIDKVFFWEVDSGENIVTYMERTLAITKVFVFFCSENSIRSKAVEDEWQAAFQMRKKGLMKIVPIYEKEDLIPFLLTPLLNVKFTKDDFDGFIQKLYEEILR
ncbi:MAG: right-handed parallel beta-helix repeat-containing protein [Candidatus Lokiarchaeota archaeon]|nr:right-handed parallel beta-helix repeat-containing protein [Candidatus Lokiarchaeota archaeon]